MDFDGIEKFDFDELYDKEILEIYNDVIEVDGDNDFDVLVDEIGNGFSYSK